MMNNTSYKLFATLLVISALQNVEVEAESTKSSIQASYVVGRSESSEEMNTPRLQKMAKISRVKALNIARSVCKGTVKKIDLENEDGNVIWSVEIGQQELAIDAGNGKILSSETSKPTSLNVRKKNG